MNVSGSETMTRIKVQDVVEVLPGCIFSSLVYSTGVVVQSLNCRMAVVRFPQKKHWTDPKDVKNPYLGTDWLIPFNKLKVLDSPHDTMLGNLEEEILGLEADLVTSRACLAVSEELRERQHDLIEKLVQEIDMLKAEVYHLRNLNG